MTRRPLECDMIFVCFTCFRHNPYILQAPPHFACAPGVPPPGRPTSTATPVRESIHHLGGIRRLIMVDGYCGTHAYLTKTASCNGAHRLHRMCRRPVPRHISMRFRRFIILRFRLIIVFGKLQLFELHHESDRGRHCNR